MTKSTEQQIPRIGAEWPGQGGIYAGTVRGEDGQPDHHLILLPNMAAGLTWQQALDFAKDAGGALPTRREQAILFGNLKDQFEPRWYWSCEQHASNPECAWMQYFANGTQHCSFKDIKHRARAVRRFEILTAAV